MRIAEQWDASGLSAQEFAARIGVTGNTLRNWKRAWTEKKFSREKIERVTRPSNSNFIEFVATREISSKQRIGTEKTEPIEIFLRNGSRILIPPQFDAASLLRIVDTLEGR